MKIESADTGWRAGDSAGSANVLMSRTRGSQMAGQRAVFTVDVILDRTSPVPLYLQISEPIRQLICDGRLAPGERLEDEVSLANRLRVSRPTARKALQCLVDKGLIVRRRGVGTQVAPEEVHRPAELVSLNEQLIRAGHMTSTEVLDYSIQAADLRQSGELGLPPGTPVAIFRRVRISDGEPLAVLDNVMPALLAPTREDLGRTGLYDLLRNREVHLASARQSIGAKRASRVEAAQLAEKPGSAVLTMTRTTYDDRGQAIEYGNHVFRASRYSFESTVFVN
ncbi:GntR family transcriptional regulator [Propionibacterium sp.]|uniref:GntR family transcriptional regulator n=1 Tax=Propionibacterium sp. TaxID=1977903 RepID=UPI0039EC74F7